MPVITTGAILGAAGISALGSAAASAFGYKSSRDQMAFQKKMSNTSHRREMLDLKAAGLNPLLTGKYGGASTPPGTSFTPDNPVKDLPAATISAATLKQQKPLIAAQTAASLAQTDKTAAEAEYIRTQTGRMNKVTPKELDEITSRINLNVASTARGIADVKRINKEIQVLTLQLKKLNVTRRLWDATDQLTPEANDIVKKLRELKRSIFGK